MPASVPYLALWGLVAGGWQLARGARAASTQLAEGGGDADFYRGKIATARFYADCLLPQAAALVAGDHAGQRGGARAGRRAVLTAKGDPNGAAGL